jgi:nucleotide-binding universal stress UspA family protein
MDQLVPEVAGIEHRKAFLHTILVAYDFSESAETALKYAIDLSRTFASLITVIHVQSSIEFAAEMESGLSISERRKEIDSEMQSLRKRLIDEGVKNQVLHRAGTVADVMIGEAAEIHADLIVLGAFGSKRLDPLRLGSTAEALIRAMPCDTMVIGPEAVIRNSRVPPIRRILYAIPAAQDPRSIKFAEQIAQGAATHLEIACVINPEEHLHDRDRKELEQHCAAFADKVKRDDLAASWTLLYGSFGDAIACHARNTRANLILLDTEVIPGGSFVRENLLSSTIQQAPCPVLVMAGH